MQNDGLTGRFRVRHASWTALGRACVIALAVGACAQAEAQTQALAPTITLPYLLGLTGSAASFGNAGKIGIELAEKTINEAGGIRSMGGARIKVELVDHQSKQDIAFSRVRDVARRSEIPFAMGALSSGATIAATESAERARLPFLVDGSNDDQITSRGLKYVVNLSMPMSEAASESMRALRELSDAYSWKLSNIAILIHDDPPGPTTLKALDKGVAAQKFKVLTTLGYAESTTDFSPVVARLATLKPDLTIQQSYPSSAMLITKTMREQGYNPPAVFGIMGGHALNNYVKQLGPDATGTIFTSYWNADLKFKGAEDFARRYAAAGLAGVPDPFTALAYRTVIAAAYILELAKSTDRDKVLETMKRLDVKEGDWPLYPFPGGVKFNEKGENVRDQVTVVEWIDGVPKSIWPLAIAGARPVWPKPAWK
jgi:branched-chain amino acid transport system substrate-binding protein